MTPATASRFRRVAKIAPMNALISVPMVSTVDVDMQLLHRREKVNERKRKSRAKKQAAAMIQGLRSCTRCGKTFNMNPSHPATIGCPCRKAPSLVAGRSDWIVDDRKRKTAEFEPKCDAALDREHADSGPTSSTSSADSTSTSASTIVLNIQQTQEISNLLAMDHCHEHGCEIPIDIVQAMPSKKGPRRKTIMSPDWKGSVGSAISRRAAGRSIHIDIIVEEEKHGKKRPIKKTCRRSLENSDSFIHNASYGSKTTTTSLRTSSIDIDSNDHESDLSEEY